MLNSGVTRFCTGAALTMYVICAVAWAGIAPDIHAAVPDFDGVAAVLFDPNTWVFIGWESIFIIAGLTVRALVVRLTS